MTPPAPNPAYKRQCTDAPRCPCYRCSERRAFLRSIGREQPPALDWRGVPIYGADELPAWTERRRSA